MPGKLLAFFFFSFSIADEATLSCVNSGRENTGAHSNTPLSLSSCSFIPSPAVSAAARGARLSKEKSLSSRREKRQTLPCLPLIRVVRGARVRLGVVEGRTKSWVDLKAVFNSQSHPTPPPPPRLTAADLRHCGLTAERDSAPSAAAAC